MPAPGKKDPSLPKGRKRTDKSLSAERAKTDESLSAKEDKAERQADAAVSSGRAEADATKSLARLDADHTNHIDASLRLERQTSDEALESERRHMDSVLELERKAKKEVQHKLFQTERGETDKNLTDERLQMDSDALDAARFLSEEKKLHVAAKAALTTRDEFLAIVSHDLKNPLSAIIMAVNLLSDKIYDTSEVETREYLELIERNATEAVRLIGDLLDMERMATGNLGLQMERHDICKIVQQSLKGFQLLASANNLHLQFHSSDAAIFVTCDQGRNLQVLSNLIGNAIKFTPKGGTISLTVQSGVREARISVSDTGPGIPDAMRKTIFERFSQITKSDRRGLGLGLYISTMIVEAHGGRIWVDEKVPIGSTFHYTLPSALA